MGRVGVLLDKEWAELVRRRGLLALILGLPVLFLALAFAAVVALPALAGESVVQDPDLQRAFDALRAQAPELGALGPVALFQVLMFRQFLLFLLLIPLIGAMTIASYAIVGEKIQRSLEPLLATPITTRELLVAKCLAAGLPSVAVGWLFFGFYLAGIALLAEPGVFAHVWNLTTLLLIFVLGPLVGTLSLSLAVLASAHSSDPRSAQQVAAVVILPIVAVFIGQLLGAFFVTTTYVLAGAAVLVVGNAIVLEASARLFQREKILTRWK